MSDDDITHYHLIVVALNENIRIMAEIDEVIKEHGGWPRAFQKDAPEVEEQSFRLAAEPSATY